MRAFLTVLVASTALAITPAQAAPPPAAVPSRLQNDDVQQAIAALGSCLHLEALEYDDHQSDAATIARAALAACFTAADHKADAMELVMSKAGAYVDRDQSRQRQETENLNLALLMVLRERREWSSAKPPGPAHRASTPAPGH